MSLDKGVILGCDCNQEWLLPWWCGHYFKHNAFPLAVVDFGLSPQAIAWCRKNAIYIPSTATGSAWKKKPSAILASPFSQGIWIDLDCEVRGSLEPIFSILDFDVDIALVRDESPAYPSMLPEEVHYNSGVIAFQRGSSTLRAWEEAALSYKGEQLKDQELLSRVLYLNQTSLFELSPVYNWPRTWGQNPKAVIHHFFGGIGKIEILNQLGPEGLRTLQKIINEREL